MNLRAKRAAGASEVKHRNRVRAAPTEHEPREYPTSPPVVINDETWAEMARNDEEFIAWHAAETAPSFRGR